MLELLKEQEREKIVLIKLGVFYIATGSDAVLLHNELGLKCICHKNNICKIGIPVNSIEKYTSKIISLGYPYVRYSIDKEKQELKIEESYRGKREKPKLYENLNCLKCKGIEQVKENDIYLKALMNTFNKMEKKDED